MRSSAFLVAALVGVASAGMPGWPGQSSEFASDVYGGGPGPTNKPHLGPGPVSERPRPEVSFSTGLSKDHHTEKEYHGSGGIFPTGLPKEHHPEKYHMSGGMYPTGLAKEHHPEKYHNSGGIFPSGGPEKHHSEKYHYIPTGSGVGPTGTGHGGRPHPTPGPHTTMITTTSDVTSKNLLDRILMTLTNPYK